RPVLAAGGLDEDAAHGLGGGGEEVSTAVPATVVASPDQPKVCLMNQGGGLEGVVGGLTGHARGGELPQLVVHEREQVGAGPAVTGGGSVQQSRHIGHSASVTLAAGSG